MSSVTPQLDRLIALFALIAMVCALLLVALRYHTQTPLTTGDVLGIGVPCLGVAWLAMRSLLGEQ